MKSICIVRRKHYPFQRNVRRDAEALVKAGYEVDVICTGDADQKKFEIMNGVNIHRIIVPYNRGNAFLVSFDYGLFFLLSFLKLSWMSFQKRYVVVEINTMPDFLVFITIISRLLGSKIVLYMFEDMPTLFMSSYHVGPNHIGTCLLRLLEKWSAEYADHVIVSDGEHYKQALEKRGIPSAKITVILNVPDAESFDFEKRLPPLQDSPFRLVIVSTLVRRYGVQTLVKAVPLVAKSIPGLIIDVVGDGEFRPHLQQLAQQLEVEKYFIFRGWVDYAQIPDIIRKANIGLAPMIDDVGLPNKLFEYFALGIPAIASAQPSLLIAFGNSNTVAFFEPDNERELADRILELYSNTQKRASLISQGFNFYNRFRWPVIKQDYLKIYAGLSRK